MNADIVLLPGDGVGPEVTARRPRRAGGGRPSRFGHVFAFAEHAIGGAAIDATGDPLPAATLGRPASPADAVFLGAVGGPKWDGAAKRPEQGLLAIRKAMGLFANLRPVVVDAPLIDRSPLKPRRWSGVDILIVRELTGGVYFGERTRTADHRHGPECTYSAAEIERVAHVAFEAAQGRRGRLTSVDKANVLETSRLWRETVTRLHRDYPEWRWSTAWSTAAAMKLITAPAQLRRGADREHVRRHPERRGQRAGRLHRPAGVRLTRRQRALACSSRSTAARRTLPSQDLGQPPSAPSAPPPCCCVYGLKAGRWRRTRWRPPWPPQSPRAS